MRNKNIDLLKGVSILYVIYYHLVWNGMALKNSPSALLFQTVCMQLFFMISGYLSYKSDDNYLRSINATIGFLNKKIKFILLPTVVMFLFSVWFFGIPIREGLMDIHKNGYWFTYILSLLFIIWAVVIKPLENKWNNGAIDAMIIFASFLLMVGSLLTGKVCGKELSYLLSLPFVLKYWFFFIMGYYLSKYSEGFKIIISNQYVRAILLLIAFIPLNIIYGSFNRYLLECIVSPARVIVVFCLFQEISISDNNKFVVNELMRFGRHSLEIYFIQFYFIFGLSGVASWISEQYEIVIWRSMGATLPIELMFVVPVSIFVAYLCLLTRRIVDFAPPPISQFFLGPKAKD